MMLSMEDARGRRWGLLTGRGLWRWRMDEYRRFGSHQAFNTWTSSWVRYLQSKDDPSRLQLQYAEEVPLGGRWSISGRLKDASGEWTSAARMHMKLTDAEGDTASYNLLQDGERYYFGIQTRASGIHRFQVTSNLGEETFVQRGQFYVEDEALELQTKGADTALMGQLARQTGGKVFHLDSVQDLQAHFGAQTFEPLIRSRQERRALIDWKIFFFLILLLLATEWGLRRYFGLY